MKKIVLFIAFLYTLTLVYTQNPPTIKWKQIKSDNFRIIYPEEIEDFAIETLILQDSLYKSVTKDIIKKKPKPIDLLFFNRSVVSNAYAAIAPLRMAWYMTPPNSPSLTISPWNQTLGIHEFRHITQYSRLNQGFTKLASLVAGQFGQATFVSWGTPNWFFEGDAIYNETKFTNSGRGRMPGFELPIRTILLENQKISYETAFFRSYKTYYPNHYYLGYFLVTNINRRFGETIWNKILKRNARYSWWPFSFERSVKKYTGMNVRKTYKFTNKELDSIWTTQLENTEITEAQILNNKKKKVWTNYFSPQLINSDTLLVLKSGFDDNNTLYYLFKNGKEEKVKEINTESISYSCGKIVWSEYKEGIRFEEQSYNNIVLFDLKTKKRKIITKKGKYFSPEISHDAKKIVAIKFSTDLKASIVILDLEGNEIKSFAVEKGFPMTPIWNENNQQIIFTETNNEGEALKILDVSTGNIKTLIEPHWIKFDKLEIFHNYVIFNYDYSGITNIYAIDINTKEVFQITSRKYSASQAIIDETENYIYFTDYNLNGLDIYMMELKPDNWKSIKNIKKSEFEYFRTEKTDTSIIAINPTFTKNQKVTYPTKKYNSFIGLFNFHSWLPTYKSTNYKLQLYSNNLLNTLELITSISGNKNYKSLFGSVDINYKKYFPIFNLNYTVGQYGISFDKDNDYDSLENWNSNSLKFGITIPLNLSDGIYKRNFEFNLNTSATLLSNFQGNYYDSLDLYYTKFLTFNTYAIFSNRKYLNYRDIQTNFGQTFQIGASYTPYVQNLYGFRYYAQGVFFLPGFFNHHGVKLSVNYENKTSYRNNVYYFPSVITYPRGYEEAYSEKIFKTTFDYVFPICYPDINIPYILFIKRIRANLFYDYAIIDQGSTYKTLETTGAEIVFDFNIFRFNLLTFDAGIRANYLLNEKTFVYEFIFLGMNFKF